MIYNLDTPTADTFHCHYCDTDITSPAQYLTHLNTHYQLGI